MRFHTLRELPIGESDSVYRASKIGPMIALVSLAAMIAALHWFPARTTPVIRRMIW